MANSGPIDKARENSEAQQRAAEVARARRLAREREKYGPDCADFLEAALKLVDSLPQVDPDRVVRGHPVRVAYEVLSGFVRAELDLLRARTEVLEDAQMSLQVVWTTLSAWLATRTFEIAGKSYVA